MVYIMNVDDGNKEASPKMEVSYLRKKEKNSAVASRIKSSRYKNSLMEWSFFFISQAA